MMFAKIQIREPNKVAGGIIGDGTATYCTGTAVYVGTYQVQYWPVLQVQFKGRWKVVPVRRHHLNSDVFIMLGGDVLHRCFRLHK